MFSKKNKTKGFTLIELLVVVAIISLLSSVVLASVNSARSKARNASRLSSVHTLVNAFNLGLNGTNAFPSPFSLVCVSVTCYDGWATNAVSPTVDAFLSAGLSSKPSDPGDSTRSAGGFLYSNPYAPTGGPTGAYIVFILEGTVSCSYASPIAGFTVCFQPI